MQNESYPRRNMASLPIRRGSQRAGRSPRAKEKRGRSFSGLEKWKGECDAPCGYVGLVNLSNLKVRQGDDDRPMPVRYSTFGPLVDSIFRKRLPAPLACIGNRSWSACATNDFRNSESRSCFHV